MKITSLDNSLSDLVFVRMVALGPYPVMGLPPSFVHASHFTDREVEDVASTDTMVDAEGPNVCVMVNK